MEMEVMMPSPTPDFNFDSASTTPYMSTSTTPYMSAPPAPPSPSSGNPPPRPPLLRPLPPRRRALPRRQNQAPQTPPRNLYSPSNSPRKNIFSPRHKSRDHDVDPFAAAINHTTKEASTDRRGRDRTTRNKGSSSRSLSPFRVSDLLFEPENETTHHNQSKPNTTSVFSSSFWYKKWKIKDLLLFRSASESRAKDKDNMKQYSKLKKPETTLNRNDDVKNSSFRSTESVGSVSSRRRTGPPISAHELHYTVNRAFSEEMRRRTSLPYKQGLLGCLGFNPAPPEISKGAASMPRV
ncbi:formin-like protein 10 [Salvia splendens]|uniref:formin-like protein 10 n=1 Tax=Salvia splendens TaxID=180675 RepID=UPI001C25A8BB|nr:formin-like protein 10 [Salvia splendens]